MLLKEDIVDIEKPVEISSLTFDVDYFQDYLYIFKSFILYTQDLHK